MKHAVRIDSGPIRAEDQLRHVPQEQWRSLMLARRQFMEIHLPRDCRRLLEFVEDAEQMCSVCGFASVEQYIRDGLGLDPEQVNWAVDGLRRMEPDEPIPFQHAVEIGKLGKRGRPKKIEEKGVNRTLIRGSGNRAYILLRLDRDGFADLAARVRARVMSANAAAIEAGFRKRATPLERIRKQLPELTAAERQQLKFELEQMEARVEDLRGLEATSRPKGDGPRASCDHDHAVAVASTIG
jgi:hypothetical protein